MKRYNKSILLSLFLFFVLSNCSDEFLDRTPFNGYTSENFWENEDQITRSVNGIYPILRNQFSSQIWQAGEFRSDNTTFLYNPADRGGRPTEELDYFVANSSSGLLSGLWSSSYGGISRANFVLERIGEAQFINEANRPIREAEARFLRAFFYYHLTIHFGNVPLVDKVLTDGNEAVQIRRSPVSEIYSQIIVPDLEFAIDQLPASFPLSEKGRATKGAAQMLLAKAYFAQRNYEAALPPLNDLINSMQYALEESYRDIFNPLNEGNKEIIFAAEFSTAANQGSGFMVNWLPFNSGGDITDGTVPGSRAGLNSPTFDMIEAYEEGDKRKDASVGIYERNGEQFPYINKYVFPPIVSGGTDVDWPIFRYADALLMQAEALVETQGGIPNEAFQTINLLRGRAGLPLIFPGNPNQDLNVDTQEKLRDFIRKERRVELAFESCRWYDLLRWEIAEETMIAHGERMKMEQSFLDPIPEAYTTIQLLLGIPAGQIIQFNYEQNPGW